jgi:hypothetical protein
MQSPLGSFSASSPSYSSEASMSESRHLHHHHFDSVMSSSLLFYLHIDHHGPYKTVLTCADTKLVDEHERVAEERVLVRKIDVLLMPLFTILYGLQFVHDAFYSLGSILVCADMLLRQYEKLVFSSAAVFGMLADLHLSTPVPGTNLVSTKRYSTAYVHSSSLIYFLLAYILINHI